MPLTSQIIFSLLLLVIYTLADASSLQAQEGALAALLTDDTPESSSGQVATPSWTTDESSGEVSASGWAKDEDSGPDFGLPPASNPVIDSSELPLLGGGSTDCGGTPPEQIQLASRLKRSRLVGKREKPFCANPQLLRSNPTSESVPGSGRSQTKGPSGPDKKLRHPEPEAEVIQNLVTQVRGVLGESNEALCSSSDPYYRVPICVPFSPSRFSPTATIEPARLCKLISTFQFLTSD